MSELKIEKEVIAGIEAYICPICKRYCTQEGEEHIKYWCKECGILWG